MSPTRFSIFKNAITIFGAALTTTGAILFLAFFLLELAGMHTNPYMGMIFLLICPGLFVAGLVIMPLGAWLAHRRDAAGLKGWRPTWPRWPSPWPASTRADALCSSACRSWWATASTWPC